MNIAYLANSFPEPVEPYVWEEIEELRKRGVTVVPCSMRRPRMPASECPITPSEVEHLLRLRPWAVFYATWLLVRHFFTLRNFVWRVLRGPEKLPRRLRALAHTWLGAYLAAQLARRDIEHIHVHHGYFASWIGMIAARILRAGFSMTLHGSDLLARADYLDVKLAARDFCCTVSEFNRRYIVEHYPPAAGKVLLRRLGVDLSQWRPVACAAQKKVFSILSVGRLHTVKNHQFLILACHNLKAQHVNFRYIIAGEGPERKNLWEMIVRMGLQHEVILLGHVSRERLPELYAAADAVVLNSHSEGVPVTLMEAMAMERLVIAPQITGLPELVKNGVSGLLYSPGSISDFLAKLEVARTRGPQPARMRRAARQQIACEFNGTENLERFAADFISRVDASAASPRTMQEPTLLNELTAHS